MRTVNKALKLLGLFTVERGEWGLSDIARKSGIDKATTHRMLKALAEHGLLEQDQKTRLYRLGTELLRLARVREATFPLTTVLQPVVEQLRYETGETCHASLFAGGELSNVVIAESRQTLKISMEQGLRLPLHATASGLVFLAYSPEAEVQSLVQRELATFTPNTVAARGALDADLAAIAARGYSISDQAFELNVFSIAAPMFAASGGVCGAIAVATPVSRIDTAVELQLARATVDAALRVTRLLGAAPPPSYLEAIGEWFE